MWKPAVGCYEPNYNAVRFNPAHKLKFEPPIDEAKKEKAEENKRRKTVIDPKHIKKIIDDSVFRVFK